jgi:hypothetical protein
MCACYLIGEFSSSTLVLQREGWGGGLGTERGPLHVFQTQNIVSFAAAAICPQYLCMHTHAHAFYIQMYVIYINDYFNCLLYQGVL